MRQVACPGLAAWNRLCCRVARRPDRRPPRAPARQGRFGPRRERRAETRLRGAARHLRCRLCREKQHARSLRAPGRRDRTRRYAPSGRTSCRFLSTELAAEPCLGQAPLAQDGAPREHREPRPSAEPAEETQLWTWADRRNKAGFGSNPGHAAAPVLRSYVNFLRPLRRPPRVGNSHFTPIDAIGRTNLFRRCSSSMSVTSEGGWPHAPSSRGNVSPWHPFLPASLAHYLSPGWFSVSLHFVPLEANRKALPSEAPPSHKNRPQRLLAVCAATGRSSGMNIWSGLKADFAPPAAARA